MPLERDNTAERLARIDKLVAENKSTPQGVARLQASLMVVSVPQGPALAVGRKPRRIASALSTFPERLARRIGLLATQTRSRLPLQALGELVVRWRPQRRLGDLQHD